MILLVLILIAIEALLLVTWAVEAVGRRVAPETPAGACRCGRRGCRGARAD